MKVMSNKFQISIAKCIYFQNVFSEVYPDYASSELCKFIYTDVFPDTKWIKMYLNQKIS